MSYVPSNDFEMQKARNATTALLENLESLPDGIELYPLEFASYSSLCIGCTDPRAKNYDPLAEVDDNSCI